MNMALQAALTLDVLRGQQMLAVPDHVAELGDPVAQDDHAGLLGELQVHLDVAMAVDEIINVGVILYVTLREEYQMLAALTHVGRLLAAWALQP